ncbi:MAG TPA: hypothetical protein VK151_00040 [Fluviicola sp.]|nr:hypothetical protein [Fluviicola sp.]
MKTNPVNQGRRSMAWLLLLTFCFEIFMPTTVYATGGGPTQPEVHGFTPIGVSDMVDPFTGDFSYNIPLMDVEGYPINIAYNAGITMDQEASWVGLGWNLTVGSVVRNMRGLPDDFNGDLVEHTTYMKPNRTIGLDAGLNFEFFGKEFKKSDGSGSDTVNLISLNASMGIDYNNYNGYSTQFSFGPSFSFAKSASQALTAGFSLSGSSENGASFAPSLSFATKMNSAHCKDQKMTSTIGSALNSRAGLREISYQHSMSAKESKAWDNEDNKSKGLSTGISSAYDLGLAHYSPTSGPSMFSTSLSGRLKVAGLSIWGADAAFSLGISYSSQWIPDDQITIETPSYGYFFLENGQKKEKAQLDFNRDNDASFTKYTPNLPSAFLTADLFSIQAQGASGSYRGFRNEVGYVFDPKVSTTNASGSFGLEFGAGFLLDLGADISVCVTNSHTGGWDGPLNKAKNVIGFEHVNAPLENYALQDASESSVDTDPLMTQMGGAKPMYFPLQGALKFIQADDRLKNGGFALDLENNSRSSRVKRNQVMQFLTHDDLEKGFGLDTLHGEIHVGAKSHHIGEITQLGTDGRRYVFGIAAYNHFQEDATFATGVKTNGDAGIPVTDAYNGLIYYTGLNPTQTLSPDNQYGIDHYYNSTVTPAYAHSFLLTAVLSDDYSDSDGEQGPSIDDLGAYVKFAYEKVDSVKWRSPMPENSAFRNEGLKVNVKDDKASFTYGQKDLWYVKVIETKNYVAVFTLEDRDDGAAAAGRNGGIDGAKRMKLLRKITLYSRPDYEANIANLANATPLQEVHFEYDYSLCQDYPANTSVITDQKGKLTLKEIFFTYQGSGKMKRSSYTFEYNGENPSYNLKAVDRWGNYKPTSSGLENTTSSPMNNADFPYTTQNQAEADENTSAWSLTAINLPSGGRIEVEYESDDYAYVQHLQAMQMFPIVGTDNSISDGDTDLTDYDVHSVSTEGDKNQSIYFRMKSGYDNIHDYVQTGQFFYFRCLVDFREDEGNSSTTKYDYVSGYGMVGAVDTIHYMGDTLGKISFVGERLRDDGGSDYNPISKFALQFGRMHLSQYVVGNSPDEPGEGEGSLTSFANSVVNAFSSFEELFDGPNKPIWEEERGREIVMNKSWIRLLEPSHKKLGGGHRVKRILMYDNWDAMTGDNSAGFSYGQEFTYTLEDGTSSGVASYEPQIGGDENPWHKPIPYANKIRWGTDDKLYQEEPLMESQFPSANVGYSRVEIRDLIRENVSRTATGKVVKEFYTAKDFPTIVRSTDVAMKTSNSFLPVLPKYQYMTASQGFTIELNDMHGKPKKESIYSEGNNVSPLSTVEYFYKQENLNLDGVTNYKLTNNVNTINAQGVQSTAEIGVKYEAVSDFRESKTTAIGGTIAINTNSFLFGFIPIVVPTIWPSIDITDNQFHSATHNKVVNRFGILEKIRANQDGSIVETNNLAYDAETGEMLASQTTTNFNDKVYSMNYPAYWYYDQLGQAYRNIGITFGPNQDFSNSGFTVIPSANSYFVEGDELAISAPADPEYIRGWVLGVAASGITVVDAVGQPVTLQNTSIKVIRSGRRNKQNTSMASLTSLSNPLNSISSNVYPNVLNAGAVEFSQDWKTYCNCFRDEEGDPTNVNPYTLGTLGNWRPFRSFTHLSGRTQSNFDDNTNIRRDGVFTSYTPYYRLQNSQWNKNQQNWTYVSEVTAFSPNGMVLETRDALGRYGASLFGYNNTLTTAVAANTRLQQVVYAGFEDVDYSNCMDRQLGLESFEEDIERADAHTGRYSLKVETGSPLTFTSYNLPCEETICSLELDEEADNLYNIINGEGPYNLEIEVITGAVDASIQGTHLISIEGNVADYYEIKVTVTDVNGCRIIQIINND